MIRVDSIPAITDSSAPGEPVVEIDKP